VRYCAVFAIRGAEGNEDDVVACVVPDEGAELSADEIHAYATATMPTYMRPRIVRILDNLPRTATNKVEKYKLRELVLAELGSTGAPGGPVEAE
jgi:crotonobetaine/carnitine-CoA ligase